MKVQETHPAMRLPDGFPGKPGGGTLSRGGLQRLTLAWGLLRLPLLLMLLYLLREPVIALIERVFDIVGITLFAIQVFSTPVARSLAFVGLVVALLLVAVLARRRLPALPASLCTVAVGSLLIVLTFKLSSTGLREAWLPVLVLAVNLMAESLAERSESGRRLWRRASALALGLAELFFLRRYLDWLHHVWSGRERTPAAASAAAAALPGVLIASLVSVVMMDNRLLSRVEQSLRMPPEVHVLTEGDFNWIELDASGRHLYVTGHGVERLRRYALADFSAPPLVSSVPTDGAQGFAYDPQAQEIYVYSLRTRTLMFLDAGTLQIKRALPLTELSPGDPWIAVDPRTDTLTIVSEADEPVSTPFLVLDRRTGSVLDRRRLDPGSVLRHPEKSLLYLSFFRNGSSLLGYDLGRREVVLEVPADARVDRMVHVPGRNELLLASPLRSRVLRFDAETLNPLGSITALFGVRVLALDSQHGLLLAASLVTGRLAVIDIESGETRKTFYLGPWLRSIALDAASGTAYVSSQDRLYKVKYGDRH